MDHSISVNRKFKIWSYSISHSRLLFRSVKDENYSSNLDLIFFDVKRIECDNVILGLKVSTLESGVFLINNNSKVFAFSCAIYENNLDMFECDFDIIGKNSILLEKIMHS